MRTPYWTPIQAGGRKHDAFVKDMLLAPLSGICATRSELAGEGAYLAELAAKPEEEGAVFDGVVATVANEQCDAMLALIGDGLMQRRSPPLPPGQLGCERAGLHCARAVRHQGQRERSVGSTMSMFHGRPSATVAARGDDRCFGRILCVARGDQQRAANSIAGHHATRDRIRSNSRVAQIHVYLSKFGTLRIHGRTDQQRARRLLVCRQSRLVLCRSRCG